MNKYLVGAGLLLALLATSMQGFAQRDKENEPTSWLYFTVIKDDNGKPVRNAAVVLHPVNEKGRQQRGGLELKTSSEGKAEFDGVPYGVLRVQVLARGFQTYGEDFDIQGPKTEITIKLKRPQGQFSIYEDHPNDAKSAPKPGAAQSEQRDKKSN